MPTKLFIKPFRLSLPGTAVTGITGGVVGSFMGGPAFIIGMGLIGAIIGNVVWMMGGQEFFLFIVVGIFLGSGLAIYLSGMESALIGAGTGGAIGGFVAVNKSMLKSR